MTFDDVNTNRFEVGGTGKDSVPRIGKRPWQPYAGGVYRPLTNGSNTEKSSKEADAARTVPSDFAGHHGTRLFVAKDSIHHESPSTHGSIHTGARSNAVRRVNESAETAHRTAEIMVPIAAAETTPTGSASASPSTEPSDTGSSSATSASAIAADVLRQAATGAKAIGRTARRTAASVKNTAAKAREAWHTFTNLKGVQFVIAFFRKVHAVWKKRHRFSYSFYAIILFALTAFEVIFIQWGMYSEPKYEKGQEVEETTRILNSVAGRTTKFVAQMWLEQKNLVLLNFIILGIIYLTLVFVLNRFWVSTAIFGAVMTTYAVANHIKMVTRNEPVLPADLNFITGGNTGELTSFIPKSSQWLVDNAITGVTWLVVICIIMQFLDGRNGVIHCSWRHPIASVKNFAGTVTRIAAAVCSIALCASFVWGFGNEDYWSTEFAKSMGDSPQIWNGLADSTNNGPVVNFLRLAHTKTMDKPEGYSQDTMKKIAKKYAKAARQINRQRTESMTDNTVIMILSESFSDPTRVPGVSFAEDPMPNIRQLKTQTTSGLMLSPGYGGGTANIEYQALTGLSMANYSSTLSIAYQQLVPSLKWAPTVNQLWNKAYDSKNASTAFHAYNRNMYFRDLNYKKFGFSKFYATDGKPKLTNLSTIDSAWYASDASFYSDILKAVSSSDKNKFYQVVTMQNHMPYENFYADNRFKELDTSQNLGDDERNNIDTYTQGLNYTDQSTIEFLNKLNEIDRPITVVFYGDHLPGIYSTAYSDKNNVLGLHETDYFIWSNNASKAAGTKLDDKSSAYTSSNYFSAQLAQHLNAKVSPYLAFLTEMHQAIPALSVPSAAGGNIDEPVYLDASGNRIRKKNLSKTAKSMLHDYLLIQYDMSIGKNYLKDTGFVDLPK